uniref:DUF4378 domain-containing protein n=1 Tax=Arundo donax TaxID=35708 RepID=A0A0A8YBU2_ARUDO
MSPRRMSRDGRKAGGVGAGLSGHRSHETEVERCECKTACHLDEEREQEQRLSPVSVMDFPGQDDDECNDDGGGGGNGHSEDDEVTSSPTFERSLANVRSASQQLLQKIRQFERLAELDTSDVDDATTIAEDTSCHIGELESAEDDEDAEGVQDLLSLPEVSSPRAPHCFKKLLEDFFREGLSLSCHEGNSDDPDVEKLSETAKAWMDGQYCTVKPDAKAEVEEIERLGRWRCFREDEQQLLAIDVEDDIIWSLMGELVDDLC